MLERRQEQKKPRLPGAARTALAAALIGGSLLTAAVAADLPTLPSRVYHFFSGGSSTVEPGEDPGIIGIAGEITGSSQAGPVTVEDGRLWFTVDGQRLDITDLVDENTPYIFERTDAATGETGYVVAGGTAEDFGWAEFFPARNAVRSMMGENAWRSVVLVDGEPVPFDPRAEVEDSMRDEDGNVEVTTVNRPWLDAALEQLGLDGG